MKFIPRFEAPRYDNKYYLIESYGGYNKCLEINNGSVLPNCVGYAYGRFMECQTIQNCRLSTGDAKNFYSNTADGYARGQEPKLGAIICFDGGKYGHLAVVEEITDEYINCSNSMYGGSRFYMKKYYKKDGYSFQGNTGYYKCQGFIYPEVEFKDEEPQPEPTPAPQTLDKGDKVKIINTGKATSYGEEPTAYGIGSEGYIIETYRKRPYPYLVGDKKGAIGFYKADALEKINDNNKKSNEEIAKEVIQGKWGNGQERYDRLTQAGYNYNEIQNIVNALLG